MERRERDRHTDYVLRLKLGLATFEKSDLDLVCGDKGKVPLMYSNEETLDAFCQACDRLLLRFEHLREVDLHTRH